MKAFAYASVIAVVCYGFMVSLQENKVLTDEVRANAPGKFLNLKHGKVHYLLSGDDSGDLIVFIHGGGITGMEVWKNNIPFFTERGYRVLAFDLYGRGYSERPRVENSSELFKEQMTELLASLHISQPFYVVAMSMGATIAFDYAMSNFGRVKKMIIIDPAATGDLKLNPLLKIPGVSDFLLTTFWYPRAVENQRKEFVNQELFNEYANRLNYFMEFKGYKFTNHSTWLNILSQNMLAKIKTVTGTEMLLMYGDHDPYFNEQHASRYRSKMRSLRITKIENTGHMPHFEKPAEVNPIIYSFIAGDSAE